MIIAIKREDGVSVGVSICRDCADMSVTDLTNPENIPFWKVKGNPGCYAGTANVDFSGQLIRAFDAPLKKVQGAKEIASIVVPTVREMLNDFSFVDENECWNNHLLIIKSGKVYTMTNYFVVAEVEDFWVQGSLNAGVATGALECTRGENAEKRIVEAFRCVERMRQNVCFPIVLIDTKTGRRKVIAK